MERNHWWFKARLQILELLLQRKVLPTLHHPLQILNVGVATGATTTMLEKYGEVTSVEYDEDCCAFLRETLKMEVINASLTALPLADNSFDLICAFDVIEHIEEEQLAMKEINRVLKPNGIAFLTVPALMSLWSHHDEVNHHFRRYTYSQLKKLLIKEKLELTYGSYFNFLLFVPIYLMRQLSRLLPRRKNPENTGSDFEFFKEANLINNVFYQVFHLEKTLLPFLRFPVGVSLMMIGRKNASIPELKK